ncbi:MAG: hypothetical protein ACXAE3_10235, partial [Candidatus Kariarchaeaceae archaeon]
MAQKMKELEPEEEHEASNEAIVEDEIEEELDMGDMEETNPAQNAKLQDVPGLGPKSAEQLTKGGIT